MLMLVAKKIPNDYTEIAVFLGLPHTKIESIENSRGARNVAFLVLQAAIRVNDPADIWRLLLKALDDAGRRDVVHFMKQGDTTFVFYLLYTVCLCN